jgi:hypothetical protein
MSFLLGLLLLLVALVGAFLVAVVALRLVKERPENSWEYMIAVLIGVALLVWPVAWQASLHNQQQPIDRYEQLRELEDLGRYRLVDEETGEALAISVDEDGKVQLSRTDTDQAEQGGNVIQTPPESRPLPEGEEEAEGNEAEANEVETVETP